MTRIVRAALTGLGAFVSELIPAQAVDRAHDIITHEDPAATGAAAPSPEHHAGDTEPAGANSLVTPAGSTNELVADLVYAAGVVRAYAVATPDLDPREVTSLNALSERLAAASKAPQ